MSDYFTREIKDDKRTPLRRYRRRSSRYVRRYLKAINETRTRREPCARFGFRVDSCTCLHMDEKFGCMQHARNHSTKMRFSARCGRHMQYLTPSRPNNRSQIPTEASSPRGARLISLSTSCHFQRSTISLRYTATTRCSASSPRPPPKGTRIFISHWACRLRRRTLGVHRGPRRLGALEKAICDPKIDARRANVPWRVGGRWGANGRESHDRTRAGLRRGGQVCMYGHVHCVVSVCRYVHK